jgi:hypothetical protein
VQRLQRLGQRLDGTDRLTVIAAARRLEELWMAQGEEEQRLLLLMMRSRAAWRMTPRSR